MKGEFLFEDLTEKIIGAFFNVYNKLGFGFLEKVYENSMLIELRELGLECEKQFPIDVEYKGKIGGKYFADILVENSVIIELKAEEGICPQHEAQLLNYLKATDKEVGLLLNFGKSPQFKRKIFTNDIK